MSDNPVIAALDWRVKWETQRACRSVLTQIDEAMAGQPEPPFITPRPPEAVWARPWGNCEEVAVAELLHQRRRAAR